MVNWYFVLAGGNCTPPAPKAQLPNAIEGEKRVWGLVVGIMSWADGALVNEATAQHAQGDGPQPGVRCAREWGNESSNTMLLLALVISGSNYT